MNHGMTKCHVPSFGYCDHDSDLVYRIHIEFGTYLLNSLRQEVQIWSVNASLDGGVSHTILGSL